MNKEFLDALTELEREKNISKEDIITAIEDAVELAYKKNYGNYPNVRVSVDREDGEVLVLMSKEVVEDVEDDMMEVSLEEARSYDSRYELGDIIEYQVDPKDFGRIAARLNSFEICFKNSDKLKIYSSLKCLAGSSKIIGPFFSCAYLRRKAIRNAIEIISTTPPPLDNSGL